MNNRNINSIDITYNYNKSNNKIEERREKLIVLTTPKMEKKVTDNTIDNYFIDITYKILPKGQRKYKLMTITGLDNTNNNSYICFLILLCYEDQISFQRLFRYLHENYKFSPKNIHLDYCKALRNALLTENTFTQKPKLIHCFFHFVQNVVKRMKALKIIKSRINKRAFEIIKNVEIICFIKPSYIGDYKKFLKINLKNDEEKQLYLYLEKEWFSKESNYYNYYEIFNPFELENVGGFCIHLSIFK